MNPKHVLTACIFSLAATATALAGSRQELEKRLREIIGTKKAQVGIAVIIDGKDTITVNNGCRYPMMSVFKLHQALAIADYCRRKHLSFDTPVPIRKADLRPDTHSPLRDDYPEGTASVTIGGLLRYTLLLSDNNACDILFALSGGTRATDKYIRNLGINDFAVRATERRMHRNPTACYRNWTAPLETARLIELLLSREPFDGESRDFILRAMIDCKTGTDRLPQPLQGTRAVIGHKTGTADRDKNGRIAGTNDAGFVFLPDGRRYTIAVFVKDSEESERDTARIIADISQAVFLYVTGT